MRRVSDLAGWPPIGGGAYGRGNSFAISSEQVAVKEVVRIVDEHVTFTCAFEGNLLTYDFCAPNEETADKVGKLLKENSGKTLFSVGMLELPLD